MTQTRTQTRRPSQNRRRPGPGHRPGRHRARRDHRHRDLRGGRGGAARRRPERSGRWSSRGRRSRRCPTPARTRPSAPRRPIVGGIDPDEAPTTIGEPGEPTIVAFLAHWCPHCNAELPLLVDLQEDGTFDGIRTVAVLTGTNAAAPNYPPVSWLEDSGWSGDVLLDDESSTAAAAYGLTSYPLPRRARRRRQRGRPHLRRAVRRGGRRPGGRRTRRGSDAAAARTGPECVSMVRAPCARGGVACWPIRSSQRKGRDVSTIPPDATVRAADRGARRRRTSAPSSCLPTAPRWSASCPSATSSGGSPPTGPPLLDQPVSSIMQAEVQTCAGSDHVDQLMELMTAAPDPSPARGRGRRAGRHHQHRRRREDPRGRAGDREGAARRLHPRPLTLSPAAAPARVTVPTTANAMAPTWRSVAGRTCRVSD